MIKIIITEGQVKKLINKTINEIENNSEILSLRDLAEIISRIGVDFDTVFYILRYAYKYYGDERVIELFKHGTNLKIEPISRGKYIIVYK